ncbi:hypothetical protein PTKIN_Ptkin01aG0013600 [Pterospermum kingtungense]
MRKLPCKRQSLLTELQWNNLASAISLCFFILLAHPATQNSIEETSENLNIMDIKQEEMQSMGLFFICKESLKAYLAIISWHLASIVSVLEEAYGFQAIVKSKNLIKGKTMRGHSHFTDTVFNLGSPPGLESFHELVVHGSKGMADRIAYAIYSFLVAFHVVSLRFRIPDCASTLFANLTTLKTSTNLFSPIMSSMMTPEGVCSLHDWRGYSARRIPRLIDFQVNQ